MTDAKFPKSKEFETVYVNELKIDNDVRQITEFTASTLSYIKGDKPSKDMRDVTLYSVTREEGETDKTYGLHLDIGKLEGIRNLNLRGHGDNSAVIADAGDGELTVNTSYRFAAGTGYDGNDEVSIGKADRLNIYTGRGDDQVTVDNANYANIVTDHWFRFGGKDEVELNNVTSFNVVTKGGDDIVRLDAKSTRSADGELHANEHRVIETGGGNDVIVIDRNVHDYMDRSGKLRLKKHGDYYDLKDDQGHSIRIKDSDGFQLEFRDFKLQHTADAGEYYSHKIPTFLVRNGIVTRPADETVKEFGRNVVTVDASAFTYELDKGLRTVLDGGSQFLGQRDVAVIPGKADDFAGDNGSLILTKNTGHEVELRGFEKIVFNGEKDSPDAPLQQVAYHLDKSQATLVQ